ncbi:unnamed protein product, partial [Mesorhabditis belari]|uniref:Uncharacterized protein n=1 Tax=Mesorhabditis belari TaxID=2138241 RepID=A0AAF3FGD2_9BILA
MGATKTETPLKKANEGEGIKENLANKRPPRPILFEYPALPEIKLCFLVMLSVMIYAWYGVYKASENFTFKWAHWAQPSQLPLFGERFKDQSNWEWWKWSPIAFSYLPIYFGHFLVFNLGTKYLEDRLFAPLYTALSILACAYHYSPWLTFCSIAQGTFVFIATKVFKHQIAVWTSSLPIMYFLMHHTFALGADIFLVLLFVSYTLLSFISYNLETIKGPVRKEDDTYFKEYIRMMFYAFYQPYLVSLIVLYPDFERQYAERKERARDWKATGFFALRIAFWWALMEFSLHFLYHEAILKDLEYAGSLSKDKFVSLGMAMGMFFHLKYVVIFGLPTLIAKMDNMQPMDGPICIVGVVLYSKVWRAFDRGLYQFFKMYIFIPICYPTFSLPRKIFGVFVSFGFVLLWHGFYHHNYVWIGLNIVALFVEMSSKAFYSIEAVKMWREKNISDVNFRRTLGILQIVPYAFGLYSNFYFLGGSEVGALFVKRIWDEETLTLQYPFFLLISLGYFYVQTTIEVDRWKAVKAKKE